MTTDIINVAIAYDFDGTLAPGNMHDHSFFPELNVKDPNKEFWPKVKEIAQKHDMDEILAYMYLMIKEANYQEKSISKEKFIEHGKGIKFFPGVRRWFGRMNRYASDNGVLLKHYVISSGIREMIKGTEIANEFTEIFASGYMYNQDNIAIWPAVAVNYTNKTQYIFRINKGINNSWDNKSLNAYWGDAKRPVPSENIIFIGDGATDVPAMKMVNYIGGSSIAVFDRDSEAAKIVCEKLIEQDRAQYACEANYEDGSDLDNTVKNIIERISRKERNSCTK